jgi:hypothetical protein
VINGYIRTHLLPLAGGTPRVLIEVERGVGTMTVTNCRATCTTCDWADEEPLADVRAGDHHDQTGHHVNLCIRATI